MRLAVISDVHGQIEALRRMLSRIEAHGVDRCVLLGDLVDRAPPLDSLACVRVARTHRFRTREGRRRRLELVLGNHELNVLNYRLRREQQFRDGTWGVPVPQLSSREVADGLPMDDVRWLDSCPRFLYVDDPKVLLVHGGVPRKAAKALGWYGPSRRDALIPRLGFLDERTLMPLPPSRTSKVHWSDLYGPKDGPLVIFGHTTFGRRAKWGKNSVGLDCSKTGVLAALILGGGDGPIELYEEHEPTAGWLTGL